MRELYSNDSFIINDYIDIYIYIYIYILYIYIYAVNDGRCNVCYKCFGSFPKGDVKCPYWRVNMERYENDFNPYFWTESKHPIMKTPMNARKPCKVNPSSDEALLEVMAHVKKIVPLGSIKSKNGQFLFTFLRQKYKII